MKSLFSFLLAVLILSNGSAQPGSPLKSRQPVADKVFTIEYDATETSLVNAQAVSGIAVYYFQDNKTTTQSFHLKQQKGFWNAGIHIPDSAVLVSLIFMSADDGIKDNNGNKGYLLPVYKNRAPVQFAFSQIAGILNDGPPDPAGIKKDSPRALAFMKKEIYYHPESEALLMHKFYNMLANSPEKEDKVLLLKNLSRLKTNKEADLMMAQLYLSYFGDKQQADSLDRLLVQRFPDGDYVKMKQQREIADKKKPDSAFSMPYKKVKRTRSREAIIKEVAESMINESVAALTLSDIHGNKVTIGEGSLKGKIIVLDFWATWCKPCIGAFPAMEKLMDKYRNNRDVAFFFINTMEKGDAVKNVEKFLRQNAYPFTILMDERADDMNLYKAYTNYKVSGGIPYKLVIDRKGNIRFRSGGFSGNDDELIDELSAMIEMSDKG